MTSSPPPRLPEEYRDGGGKCRVNSVHPWHGNPLWASVELLKGRFQESNSVVDVVVYNREVEQMTVTFPEGFRLFGETLQTFILTWDKATVKRSKRATNISIHCVCVVNDDDDDDFNITCTSPLPPLRGLKRTAFDVRLAKLLQR